MLKFDASIFGRGLSVRLRCPRPAQSQAAEPQDALTNCLGVRHIVLLLAVLSSGEYPSRATMEKATDVYGADVPTHPLLQCSGGSCRRQSGGVLGSARSERSQVADARHVTSGCGSSLDL